MIVCYSTLSAVSHITFFFLFCISQRERGRTHRPRVPAHERRWLYFWGIQVRERAPASGAPRASFYPSTPPAPSPLSAQIGSVCLGWSSALPPSSQPLQLTTNWPRTTNNRNQKEEEEVSLTWTSTTMKHKRFLSVLGRPGYYLCRTLVWHCGVFWEAGFFRFKLFRGLGVLHL